MAVEKRTGTTKITLLKGLKAMTPFASDDIFRKTLVNMGTSEFVQVLDYVGPDYFSDALRALSSGFCMEIGVVAVADPFRNNAPVNGKRPFPASIHLIENGYPANPTRSEERQADLLKATVRTVYEQRNTLTCTHFAYFCFEMPIDPKTDFSSVHSLTIALPKPLLLFFIV